MLDRFKRSTTPTLPPAGSNMFGSGSTLFQKYQVQLDDQIARISEANAVDEAHGAIFDSLVDSWLAQELATTDEANRKTQVEYERRVFDARARVEKISTRLEEVEAWLHTADGYYGFPQQPGAAAAQADA
jgi:hypothetical protein